jgi:GMP synthase (glutamine-hydrolysing)
MRRIKAFPRRDTLPRAGSRGDNPTLAEVSPPVKPIPILRHVPHESTGTLADALAQAGLEFRCLDLFESIPSDAELDLKAAPGLIVMGGPMNVDETGKYPFLAAEADWLRQAVERRLPTLGICLGAQLLAKALGANVFPNRVKEIGWYAIELTPAADDDPLWTGCGESLTVFQWHGDTFDLPPGAVRLAQAPACRNQAFRAGDCAYGLQFHLEMTAAMIEDWLGEPGNGGELAALDYINPEAIRAAVPQELPPMEALARRVFGRFARLCR